MKLHLFLFITLVLSFIFAPSINAQKQERFEVEGANGEWLVDTKERLGDAKIADFLGRKALWLKNNSHIIRNDSDFTDGTIEFDVAPMDGGQFFAFVFRRESSTNFENIYFRAHRSGEYEALQYAPSIYGSSTWQIYPEFNRTMDFPTNQWTHVKAEISGTELKVFINNSVEPILHIARMRSNSKKGSVAFWARINDKPNAWVAAVSNLKITHRQDAKADNAKPEFKLPAGILNLWQVAKPIENKQGTINSIPQNLSDWKTAEAEESGLINLTRVLENPRGNWTAFAKTTVKTDKAKTVRLNFGYSDDVTIFLNGKPIYSGINGWESRYPGYMGFVKIGNDSVFLHLTPGDNELIFAVTNQRFGWGFVAQLVDL